MKEMFPGRYRPTGEGFDNLWRDGLFVVDANVLLNLYRYSDDTREQMVLVLRAMEDRLWLPHQAADEFLTRRLDVIHARRKGYRDLLAGVAEARSEIEARANRLHRDPVVEAEDLLEGVRRSMDQLSAHLETRERVLPEESNSPEEDEVWRVVEEIFAGRVGGPYAPEQREKLLKEGQRRYESRVPPGYEDEGKDRQKGKDGSDAGRRFGDLVLWFQVLDKAEQENKPVVFVTDDRKEDWWWKSHGKTVGPRPELVEEMLLRAGVPFYMYRPDRFMAEAGERGLVGEKVSADAIDEVGGLDPLDVDASRRVSRAETRARRGQVDFLRVLAEEVRGADGVERLEARVGKNLADLTQAEADKWIDRLVPDDDATARVGAPAMPDPVLWFLGLKELAQLHEQGGMNREDLRVVLQERVNDELSGLGDRASLLNLRNLLGRVSLRQGGSLYLGDSFKD